MNKFTLFCSFAVFIMHRNGDNFINVAIRIRPPQNENTTFLNNFKVISNTPEAPIIYIFERQLTYTFDNIFTEDSTQDDVYNELIKPLVNNVLGGYNCTIFAYGQTGTGKTYTMGSNPKFNLGSETGIISRVLNDFFERQNEDNEVEIYVSFYEVYNKKAYDLLNNKETLTVKGFKPQGLTKERVFSSSEAHQLLLAGGTKRHTGRTKQNSESSRSHAIFTIFCNVKTMNEEVTAKFNLVDLAGSESVRKTGNQGFQFQEGVHINQGLHCIGKVINALSCNAAFVPYRDSMLTTILQDSLNQNNFITLIACVSSNAGDLNETIQTLEFSQKAKKVKNKPEINSIVEKYKKDNPAVNIIASSKSFDTPNNKLGSGVKSKTPWKRPYPFQTSTTTKKVKHALLPSNSNSLSSFTSESLFSSTITSIPDNISPIVQRCVAAVEKTMLEKLEETIIKMQGNIPQTPIVNKSPVIPLKQLQTEINKIVKTELIKEMSSRKLRTRSTPLEDNYSNKENNETQKFSNIPKQILSFDDNSPEEGNNFVPATEVSPINDTKTPNSIKRVTRSSVIPSQNYYRQSTPTDKKATLTNADKPAMSEIDSIIEPVVRRSLDLLQVMFNTPISSTKSIKKKPVQHNQVQNISFNKEHLSVDQLKFKMPQSTRRSLRRSVLTLRKNITSPKDLVGPQNDTLLQQPIRRSSRLSLKRNYHDLSNFSLGPLNQSKIQQKRMQPSAVNANDLPQNNIPVRRSTRISLIQSRLSSTINNSYEDFDPTEQSRKKQNAPKANNKLGTKNAKDVESLNSSNFTLDKMQKYVMNILNTGNERQLQKLVTIGPKTASQIYLYRKLHGEFEDIQDLKNLPWKETAYRRFLAANLLEVSN